MLKCKKQVSPEENLKRISRQIIDSGIGELLLRQLGLRSRCDPDVNDCTFWVQVDYSETAGQGITRMIVAMPSGRIEALTVERGLPFDGWGIFTYPSREQWRLINRLTREWLRSDVAKRPHATT